MSMFLVPKTQKELKKDAKEREAAEAAAKAATSTTVGCLKSRMKGETYYAQAESQNPQRC